MKIVIIGGVAGGSAGAARCRRLNEDAEIIMFEKDEHISFANCGLPYYVGDVIKDRENLLLKTPEDFSRQFNVDVRVNNEVIDIDKTNKKIKIKNSRTNSTYEESFDKLIVSPGAKPMIPDIEGINLDGIYTVRNVADIDKIKKNLISKNAKRAAVIGAGFIGTEMAENFIKANIETHLIQKRDQVMTPFDKEMAVLLHEELKRNGIKLYLNADVEKITKENNEFSINMKNRDAIKCDFVIVAIGVKPEIDLFKKAGLEIGEYGVRVNEKMQTSHEDIYACGDAVESINIVTGKKWHMPLAWPAARGAIVAANNIFGIKDSFKGTYATSIIKIFSLSAASTGINEESLRKENIGYEKIYTHPLNHAGFYPNAVQISIKVLFCPVTGTIFGAQAIGKDGVDKRINALAIAVKHKLKVSDLAEMEFCYAPPFGTAKDAVNFIGMIGNNIMLGLEKFTHWDKLNGDEFLLDVRTKDEFERGSVPNSKNIPLDTLRNRLNEIPKNKKIAVFCHVGIRAHNACRILIQKGFDAYNISGGFLTYSNFKKFISEEEGVYIMNHQSQRVSLFEKGGLKEDSKIEKNNLLSENPLKIVKEINVCGLQCPGPIGKLKKSIDEIQNNEAVKILSNDIGFAKDLPGWCNATGNKLVKFENNNDLLEAVIAKGNPENSPQNVNKSNKATTIVVFSGELDKALASFIIARSAAAQGRKVTMLFTFWGLNMLKRSKKSKVKKDFLSKMFGFMMPGSISKLELSKMHMMGMGTKLMKYIMKKKNVETLEVMLKGAIEDGIEFIACSMSMDVMGIHAAELIDEVKIGGAAYYMSEADEATHNLFI